MIYREQRIRNALLRTYVLSNYEDIDVNRRRAMIIICPGGAYRYCSEREAESVAIRFNSIGYNALVLYYTVNPEEKGIIYPKPQEDLAETVKWVRNNAHDLNTDPGKIAVLGFSAGGHLAASLGVFWPEYGKESRPDALVLCYPVISSGPKGHHGSIRNLTGDEEGLVKKMSLEMHVTKDTPPTFIWTTREDQSVPFENSVMFSEALSRCGVKNELVVFRTGAHGLSLGTGEVANGKHPDENTEIQDWPERADRFLISVFGSRF